MTVSNQLRIPLAVLVLVVLVLTAWTLGVRRGARPAAPTDPEAIPVGVDTTVTLLEVASRLAQCRETAPGRTSKPMAGSDADPDGSEQALPDCAGAIYVWSPEMPLSRTGIGEIAAAAEQLEIDLAVVPASELYAFVTPSRVGSDDDAPATTPALATIAVDAASADERTRQLASELIGRGATIHFPAVIPHRGGDLTSTAIVGYKTAAAYQLMLRERLASANASEPREIMDRGAAGSATGYNASILEVAAGSAAARPFGTSQRDYRVPGQPGPYFRWVPGRNAVAFESNRVVYLLDLGTGDLSLGPGYIDFVPSPDGRFFVTPKRDRGGLEFYDAVTVFRETRRGRGQAVKPIFVDTLMRDQYPSVGVLSMVHDDAGARTTYRVLTSWFDKVMFRDYEVTARGGRLAVRPLGPAQPGCSNLQVSLPIIAPDGRQLAGRDETSATTKLFRLDDDGRCTEQIDLEMQTGKVAWRVDARRIAFAIPARPRAAATAAVPASSRASALAGLFLFDPYQKLFTRVPGTERIQRLAFPEFVGDSAVMFLVNHAVQGDSATFRFACCGKGPTEELVRGAR